MAFRIHAFSQAGEINNPIVRLGFRLFGRRVQLRFINNSLRRMRQLVAKPGGLETIDVTAEGGVDES